MVYNHTFPFCINQSSSYKEKTRATKRGKTEAADFEQEEGRAARGDREVPAFSHSYTTSQWQTPELKEKYVLSAGKMYKEKFAEKENWLETNIYMSNQVKK